MHLLEVGIELALGFITALALTTNSVVAEHVNCTWTGPGDNAPETHGYSLFCIALARRNGTSNAVYLCNDANRTRVADWNYFAPYVLAFSSPCAGNGYAGDLCDNSTYWGVCVLNLFGEPICRYMTKGDDCAWQGIFTSMSIPLGVAVYYK